MVARQSSKKSGKHTAQRQVARRQGERLEPWPEFEQRKKHDQSADDRLDRCHLVSTVPQWIPEQDRLAVEPRQQTGSGNGCKSGRNAKSSHHAPVGLPSQQPEFEEIVGKMNDRGSRHCQCDRKKQRKHRRQHGSQAETRKERQPGYEKGGKADDE